jgi:hypothetical protein
MKSLKCSENTFANSANPIISACLLIAILYSLAGCTPVPVGTPLPVTEQATDSNLNQRPWFNLTQHRNISYPILPVNTPLQ